jgi:hypothetical protein
MRGDVQELALEPLEAPAAFGLLEQLVGDRGLADPETNDVGKRLQHAASVGGELPFTADDEERHDSVVAPHRKDDRWRVIDNPA